MSAPKGFSHFWEGELAKPALQRRRICKMDRTFLERMHEHHPERSTGYKPAANTEVVAEPTPEPEVVVEATPDPITPPEMLSLHRLPPLDEAELAQIRSILRRESVRIIVEQVAATTKVSTYRIVSASRNKHVVAARNMVFRQLQEDGFSLTQIGRMFQKDHTTVLHGIRVHLKASSAVPA